jgi:hypothetical protein
MHAIDEKSPLAGYDAERLEEGDARLFLSIEARDHAIGKASQKARPRRNTGFSISKAEARDIRRYFPACMPSGVGA